MSDFTSSYVGKLRELVGDRLLLIPGARMIVLDGSDRILLHKRSDFGVWGLPGGNAEAGENLVDAVKREVAEEAGIQVHDPIPFGFGSNPDLETITFPNGDRTQFFVLNFFSRSFDGASRVADQESTEIGCFSPSELPEMLPNMRESIRAYERFLATNDFQLF